MGFLSVLSFAHKLTSERLQPGDYAVDATAGTGADTLFLAQACGKRGHVFAFDVQSEALHITQERLDKIEPPTRLAKVTLFHRSHAEMEDALPAEAHGHLGSIMFNLGYLPTTEADHSVITLTESTLEALEVGVRLLRPRGLITIVLYPGHPGGETEAAAVESWAASLPSSIGQSIVYRQLQRSTAPYLIAIEKR